MMFKITLSKNGSGIRETHVIKDFNELKNNFRDFFIYPVSVSDSIPKKVKKLDTRAFNYYAEEITETNDKSYNPVQILGPEDIKKTEILSSQDIIKTESMDIAENDNLSSESTIHKKGFLDKFKKSGPEKNSTSIESIAKVLEDIKTTFSSLNDALKTSSKEIATLITATMQEGKDEIGREAVNSVGKIAEQVTSTLKESLKNQTDAVSQSINSLSESLKLAGIEEHASKALEDLVKDLKTKAEKQNVVIESKILEFNSRLEKALSDLSKEKKTLEEIEMDVDKESDTLIGKIKKYSIGRLEVLEQQNEQYQKELKTTRANMDALSLRLNMLKLQEGSIDPSIYADVIKQNSELRDKTANFEELTRNYLCLKKENEDLLGYKKEVIKEFQYFDELKKLRDFKEKHDEEFELLKSDISSLRGRVNRQMKEKKELLDERCGFQIDFENITSIKQRLAEEESLRRECEKNLETSKRGILNKDNEIIKLKASLAEGEDIYRRMVENDNIERLTNAKNDAFNAAEEAYADTISALQRDLKSSTEKLKNLDINYTKALNDIEAITNDHQEDHKHVSGGIPERYQELLAENKKLRSQLHEEMSFELQREISQLEKNKDYYLEEIKNKKIEVESIRQEKNELLVTRATLEGEVNALTIRLDKELALEANKIKKEKDAFAPVFVQSEYADQQQDEWEWLKKIENGIKESGFEISRRLLHSFHTSLKAQDISPLSLLVGISGTGKSELPRLYADIGGIYFLMVSVQPNWDSPMDLFGFFNYADGYYHSTKLSQAMHQFVHPDSENSLKDAMLLVLLDEMNLARVEYYFSDLLSRLEARRSILLNPDQTEEQKKRASIDIDLGRDHISLFLDQNVMFAGTLNDDESTLDITDKVMDRANIITFPRPNKFVFPEINRINNFRLPQNHSQSGKLRKEHWNAWINLKNKHTENERTELSEELQKEFKTINAAMSKVNRGVGQRVFQAVFKYMLLYPSVDNSPENRKAAFGKAKIDQYAMKIIPKLKGIDLRSEGGQDCIKAIQNIIPEELGDDFKRSHLDREFFTWQGSTNIFMA